MSDSSTFKGEVRCLYCEFLTGHRWGEVQRVWPTVCRWCLWHPGRDERKEVDAGMQPWARPVSQSMMRRRPVLISDDEAAALHQEWEDEQVRIKRFNIEHSGNKPEVILYCLRILDQQSAERAASRGKSDADRVEGSSLTKEAQNEMV